MNTKARDVVFNEVVTEALKKMQQTATAVSSSYEVIRSSGEIIVQRKGGRSHDNSRVKISKTN
ncbi:MAG: hypothetical protein WA435_09755 [Gallionellaceae bacterium]